MQDVEQYQADVKLARWAACILLAIEDIPALIAAIHRAETVGPIVDPTLWLAKHQAMQEDRQLLEAALPLWRLGRQISGRLS